MKTNVAYQTTEKWYYFLKKVLGDTQYSVWSVRSSDVKKIMPDQHFFF